MVIKKMTSFDKTNRLVTIKTLSIIEDKYPKVIVRINVTKNPIRNRMASTNKKIPICLHNFFFVSAQLVFRFSKKQWFVKICSGIA